MFAEGFGFVWDDTGQMGDASPLAGLYAWTYDNITFPAFVTDTLNMSYMHIPFHRATSSLNEYVLLSVYLGVAHLMFGFILGFINVARAHGLVAAFFEKGSWIIILAAGTLHIYGFLTTEQGVFDATPYAIATLVGVVCLIIGLAVFEKFGLAGGLIMGPIETFGLLANTLSYLRVMGVGVAGVKIAEVSITMGWDLMWSGGGVVHRSRACPLHLHSSLCTRLDCSHRASTLPVSLPVEWMGKFYDGSGRVFTPIGGRTLHTEGNHSPMDNKLEVENEQEYPKNEPTHADRLATLACVAQGVAEETTDSGATDGMTGDVGVGLALGLAAIGAGFSCRHRQRCCRHARRRRQQVRCCFDLHRFPRIHRDSRCPSALPQLRTTVDRWALAQT